LPVVIGTNAARPGPDHRGQQRPCEHRRPGDISGFTTERLLRSPAAGPFQSEFDIGSMVRKGEVIGTVAGQSVFAGLDGVLRGLIRPGTVVAKGTKLGDIDPRGQREYCDTISDKARAIAGAVLEAIMRDLNRPAAAAPC
jgi:xanthine dehydrogenase accessory factor